MNERTFDNGGARIEVKWQGTEAFLGWAEASDVHALMALMPDVREFLLSEGVFRVSTTVSCADERVYKLASHFGFVPLEITMVLPLAVAVVKSD